MRGLAIVIFLVLAPVVAQGVSSLTVGEVTYENVTLKNEYPRSFFIQHDGGTAFIERSKLSEEQIAELLGVAGEEMPAVAQTEAEPQASPTPETESKPEQETKTKKAPLKYVHPDPAPGEADNGYQLAQRREVLADEEIWPTVNWASFDQDKVVSFGNFQYAVYWDADRVLTVVRRALTSNKVEQVRLTDYLLADGLDPAQQNNGHRNAVIGLSPCDGRLHLAWDHHANSLNYTRSRKDLITDPPDTITAADFEPKQPIAGAPTKVTYPAFINDHQDELMFFCRGGGSGSGDIVFFEYDAPSGTWAVVAERLLGLTGTYAGWNNSTSRNAYLHDILFDSNGRLHLSWVWREVGSTWASNHDLNYAYSDDRGRTWRNNAGEQIADVTRGEQITIDSPGIIVWPIPVYSWLMNQCGMTLDSRNNPHVATFHMEEVLVTETVTHDPPPAERWRLNYYHYWRDDDGVWHRRGPLPKPASADRPVIVAAPNDTIIIYFKTNDGIMAHVASAQSGWTDWRTLTLTGPEYTYSDASKPDRRRLKESRVLSLTADPNALTPGQRGLAFLDFPIDHFLLP